MRILILGLLCLCACTLQRPKTGQKIGHIVKMGNEGWINQTYEGELIRGSMQDGSGSFGKSFQFTIPSQKYYWVALDALENNKEVVIYYRVPTFTWMWQSEHYPPHFVTHIEVKNGS